MNDRAGRFRGGDVGCLLLLLVLTLVFFRKILFSPDAVIMGSPVLKDLTHQFYPWRRFGFGLLARGTVPLWNPYLYFGYPFVANWQSAVFYPPNILFLILPVHTAINWSFSGHIFLAGAFTYLYMRYCPLTRPGALIASLGFMFSAALILRIFAGHLSVVCSVPWIPLQLLAVEAGLRERRPLYFALGGMALGMQLLAGHPQYAFYGIIAVALYCLCRLTSLARGPEGGARAVAACLGVALLLAVGCALAAVQLVPGLEFLGHSARGQIFEYGEAAGLSLPPEQLITLAVPDAFGDFNEVACWGRIYLWEGAVYIGILPLAFALLAVLCARGRPVGALLAVGLAAFLIALGGYTPLLRFLYARVPGFNLLRGNAKMTMLVAFSLSCLAGIGADAAGAFTRRSRWCAFVVLCVIAVALAAAVSLYLREMPAGGGSPLWNRIMNFRRLEAGGYPGFLDSPLFSYRAYLLVRKGAFRLILGLGAAAVVMAAATLKRPAQWIAALGAACVLADLWSYGARFVPATPVSTCGWPPGITRFFARDGGLYRILRDIRVDVPGVNQGMNEGLFSYEGYEPDVPALYRDFSDSLAVNSENAAALLYLPDARRMASLANVKYLIVPAAVDAPIPGWLSRYDDGRIRIYENSRVMPRAFVVHNAVVEDEPRRALDLMRAHSFDPRAMVVLAEPPDVPLSGSGTPTEAEIVYYGSREVIVRCRMGEAGILFLGDMFYPGWMVTVDGVPGRIIRADHAFRAVPLQKGTHEVTFMYRPASFRIGAAVSLGACASVLCVLCGAAGRRFRRGRGDGGETIRRHISR